MKQAILAIDDEPHMLKLLERIIVEKTPYQITTLNNPLEFRDFISDKEFAIILTDLKMPGMDGIDILKHIKDRNRREEVIIMTAFGSLETALDAVNLGVFDYITKPFKKEQIIHTIDRAMRWQMLKAESTALSTIFELEPYERAMDGFKSEYIRRLARRCESDEGEMLRRSGLPENDIKEKQ